MTTKRLLQTLGILIPLLVIAIWIGSYMIKSNHGLEVTLAIRGFDPRDLLAGHYLQYEVDYGDPVVCQEDGPLCLCLGPGPEDRFVQNEALECRLLQNDCKFLLKGACKKGRFLAGIERYYFPEQYKRQLAIVPPKATIKVTLARDGQAIVTAMEVDGEPLIAWLKAQTMEVPQPSP